MLGKIVSANVLTLVVFTLIGWVNLAMADTTFPITITADAPDPYSSNPSFYYNSINNSGIGTTNPLERLDVYGDIRIGGQASTNLGTDTAQGMLSLYNYNYGIGKFTGTNTGVRIFTNTGTDIQFGSTSPSTAWPFSGGTSPAYAVTEANFQPQMTLTSSGAIGIGTTTPGYQLDVNGDGRIGNFYIASGTNYQIVNQALVGSFATSFALYQDTFGRTILNSASGQPIALTINNVDKMHIDTNGNVGIGTSGPTYKLHVFGDINATSNLTVGGSVWIGLGSVSTSNALDVNGTGRISGGLTLGSTTSGTFLYLAGSDHNHFIEETGETGNQMYFGEYSGNFHFQDTSSGTPTDVMTITGGYVGIGTAYPTAPLDIEASPATLTFATGYGYLTSAGVASVVATSQNGLFSIKASGRINSQEIDISSDRRLKDQIKDIDEDQVMKFIEGARPVRFKWKSDGTYNFGFIAQEIDKLGLHELVLPIAEPNMKSTLDPDGYLSPEGAKLTLSYNQLTAILTKVIQNLLKEIASIKRENTEIKTALCLTQPSLSSSNLCKSLPDETLPANTHSTTTSSDKGFTR